MKIKRYFAPDIRQAIQMVRDEQGPDAVILSNRNVEGGVEIVAARDFDEEKIYQKSRQQPEEKVAAGTLRQKRVEVKKPKIKAKPEQEEVEKLRRLLERSAALADEPKAKPFQTQPALKQPSWAVPRKKLARESAIETKASAKIATNRVTAPQPDMLTEMHRELKHIRSTLESQGAVIRNESIPVEDPARLDLLRRLREHGFSQSISTAIADRLEGRMDGDAAWRAAIDLVSNKVPVEQESILDQGGIVALVGPTGVGKTTTIAKLAARFRLKHGIDGVVLITTDNYRIAAHEQLGTYGRLLDIPVCVASNSEDLNAALCEYIDNKRLILIDTAGMSQHDARLIKQCDLFRDNDIPVRTYLVMSAASQLRSMQEIVKAYRDFQPECCVLTKFDEAAHVGEAFSTLMENNIPLAFVTDGQQVPEDLHVAQPALLKRFLAQKSENLESAEFAGESRFSYQEQKAHASV